MRVDVVDGIKMVMRKNPFYVAVGITGLACLSVGTLHAADWQGSYEANDQCFCAGELPHDLSKQVIPTPIGGQTIAQVCQRIGPGPKLVKKLGAYNYPVFADAQCGNGPFTPLSSAQSDCLGTKTPGSDECLPQGPKWNLTAAYGKPESASTHSLVNDRSNNETLVSTQVNGVSRYIVPQRKKQALNQGLAKNSDSKSDKQLAQNEMDRARNTSVKEIVTTLKKRVSKSEKFESKSHQNNAVANEQKPAGDAESVVVTPKHTPQKESQEQIRARQLVQMAAARERRSRGEALESMPIAQTFPLKETEPAKTAEVLNTKASSDVQNAASEEPIAVVAVAANRSPEQALVEEPLAEVISVEKQPQVEASVAEYAELTPPPLVEKPDLAAALGEAIEATTQNSSAANKAETGATPTVFSALRLPPAVRSSSREFNFVEALPRTFAFGGTGLNFAASSTTLGQVQFVLDASFAQSYREAMAGISFFFTPVLADRLTFLLTAGIENGSFEFSRPGVATSLDDTGVLLGMTSRFVVNNRFEIQAGVGFSSFFDGDVFAYGAGLLHLTRQLDLVTKAEAGDNDSFALGIRYYY